MHFSLEQSEYRKKLIYTLIQRKGSVSITIIDKLATEQILILDF